MLLILLRSILLTLLYLWYWILFETLIPPVMAANEYTWIFCYQKKNMETPYYELKPRMTLFNMRKLVKFYRSKQDILFVEAYKRVDTI